MEIDNITIFEMPQLSDPCLIAAFSGWPNAGEVATGSLEYLRGKLRAKKVAEIDPSPFHVFATSRPTTVIEDGLLKELNFPSGEFFAWKSEEADHDLVILLDTEPELNWKLYANSVLNLAEQLGVSQFYTLGGVYDYIPHTKEPRISAVVTDAGLKEELKRHDIEFTDYPGPGMPPAPSSIHTTLLMTCKERGIGGISLWGRAPQYISTCNFKVCHGVLSKLASMLGIDIDLAEIKEAGEKQTVQASKAVHENPQLRELVQKLEQIYEARYESMDSQEVIKSLEELLREQTDEESI